MLESNLHLALRESVIEVLEKMFFINAFEAPVEELQPDCLDLAAQLTFNGDPPGALTLRTSRAAARSIAADFLGEDPSALLERQVEEVVCELSNMICGAVLSRAESRAVFRLGSPRILPSDHVRMTAAADSPGVAPPPVGVTLHLADVGGSLLTVTVHTEGLACTVIEKYAY